MDQIRQLVVELDHYARRARYLVARGKKAVAGFVASLVAFVAALETILPEASVETKGLAASIVALATALGVWAGPKNEPHPDDIDHIAAAQKRG